VACPARAHRRRNRGPTQNRSRKRGRGENTEPIGIPRAPAEFRPRFLHGKCSNTTWNIPQLRNSHRETEKRMTTYVGPEIHGSRFGRAEFQKHFVHSTSVQEISEVCRVSSKSPQSGTSLIVDLRSVLSSGRKGSRTESSTGSTPTNIVSTKESPRGRESQVHPPSSISFQGLSLTQSTKRSFTLFVRPTSSRWWVTSIQRYTRASHMRKESSGPLE